MGEYKIILSEEEEKALLTDMISIQDWLDNAIKNKTSQCIDKIVGEVSDKQPSKISMVEKLEIIKNTTLETAMEKMARLRILIH